MTELTLLPSIPRGATFEWGDEEVTLLRQLGTSNHSPKGSWFVEVQRADGSVATIRTTADIAVQVHTEETNAEQAPRRRSLRRSP